MKYMTAEDITESQKQPLFCRVTAALQHSSNLIYFNVNQI